MSSPRRHVFVSLLFILICYSKPFIIRYHYYWLFHYFITRVLNSRLKKKFSFKIRRPSEKMAFFRVFSTRRSQYEPWWLVAPLEWKNSEKSVLIIKRKSVLLNAISKTTAWWNCVSYIWALIYIPGNVMNKRHDVAILFLTRFMPHKCKPKTLELLNLSLILWRR